MLIFMLALKTPPGFKDCHLLWKAKRISEQKIFKFVWSRMCPSLMGCYHFRGTKDSECHLGQPSLKCAHYSSSTPGFQVLLILSPPALLYLSPFLYLQRSPWVQTSPCLLDHCNSPPELSILNLAHFLPSLYTSAREVFSNANIILSFAA